MAVTVTEAHAINTLLRHLLGTASAAGTVPTADQARDAAAVLARSAHRTLAAGITESDVTTGWLATTG